jgi:transposase-like protein
LFSDTIEQMLETELIDELGYERYEAKGRNSGNSRDGHYTNSMRTSGGESKIKVPQDRKAFTADLKTVYQAGTREKAETHLLKLEETWAGSIELRLIPGKTIGRNWQPSLSFPKRSAA